MIDTDIRRAKRVCLALGPSPATGELWSSVVELGDSLTRYLSVERELRSAAAAVGRTDEQWQAIKEGR